MGLAYERFIEALRANGFRFEAKGNHRGRAQCPAHNGSDMNLSVADGDQGVLVKCHSYDCPSEDIAKALGLTLEDLFDKDGRAVYDYGNGHRVTRRRTRDGKTIHQDHKPAVTTLYRHPHSAPIETSDVVVLVEGEKCVDAALRLGEPCVTTWPGGAAGVAQVDITPLAGKTIRIIADNDDAGKRAAARLSARLAGLATVEGIWTAPGPKESVDDIWLRGGELSELIPAQVELDEGDDPRSQPERSLSLRTLSDMQSRRTRFLWDKKIPQSAVTIAAGRGGVAKSTFAIWLAGQLNKGTLPGEHQGKPCSVLYVSHEDSPEEVVIPRVDANGAERGMFHLLGIQSKEVGGVVVPRLPEDMPLIREAIAKTGAQLLIVDPITSTLAGGDNDRMADVRMVMDPLNAMAAELGVSVIGIAHFRKGGGNQSDMISGSHAWRDAARCVMLFARDEEEDCTVMTLDKINSGEAGQSFKYRLDIVQQLTDEGSMTDVGRVNWMGDSAQSVGDIINHESERSKYGKIGNDLLEYVRSFEGRAVRTDDILKLFATGDVKPQTVRQNLSRLVNRGLIEKPGYGFYQATKQSVTPPRARGGVTPVIDEEDVRYGSNVYANDVEQDSNMGEDVRTSNTSVTSVTPPRAREESVTLCRGCGLPLAKALIDADEVRHPTC